MHTAQTHTHCLALWVKPAATHPCPQPHLRGARPVDGWRTQTAPQNICTCTQTSHATSPQPGVGVEKPTRRGSGSHSGVGGLALGVRTQCAPCLGLLAQYGGQETPILLQGWLRGAKWSPGQV